MKKPAATHEFVTIGERSLAGTTDVTADAFRGAWSPGTLNQTFAKARQMAGLAEDKTGHWFIERAFKLMRAFYTDGFRLLGVTKAQRKWLDKHPGALPLMQRVAGDAFDELILQSNAIVLWMDETRDDDGLPSPSVLECEIVEKYARKFGVEQLSIRTAAGEPPDGLPARWADAIRVGRAMEVKKGMGDHYEAVTTGKSSSGLVRPSLGTALSLFAILELLNTADHSGAWEHGNLIRQVAKGHETRYGPRAGDKVNFLTKKEREYILKSLPKKRGAFDAVTNFDLTIAYKFLAAEFFDEKKYAGVLSQLRVWAGAVMELQDDKPSQYVLTQLKAEISFMRSRMAHLCERVFNHPDFFEGRKDRITVGWNPFSHLDAKFFIETLRAATGNGWMSPQTAQEALGLDGLRERANMKEAHAAAQEFTPPFEAKQGLLSDGRPPVNPGDTPTKP